LLQAACRLSTVEVEQPAQALAANYVSGFLPDLGTRFDDPVSKALMVPLGVIMALIAARS